MLKNQLKILENNWIEIFANPCPVDQTT